MQSYTPNYNSRSSINSQPQISLQDIITQITSLDKQNKKLLTIADNIMKTSFMRQYDQTPAVIMQLQQDMKTSFNALIQSIRQFFMSIDNKVKELGQIIEIKLNQTELPVKNYNNGLASSKKSNLNVNQNTIDDLVMRIAYMEENIKRSQQNQAKLITIIEEMNNNSNRRTEDQPTIRKQSDKLFNFGGVNVKSNNNLGLGSQQQNSFRLFAMNGQQEKRNNERKVDNGQVYQRFQQYSNHPVVESIDPSYRKGKEIPSYLCGPPKQEQPIQAKGNINYLKNSAQEFQIQSSNRFHRLSNLINALKE